MLMLLASLDRRLATAIRLVGLALIALSVLSGSHHPGTSGRGLVISVAFVAAGLAWLAWTARPDSQQGVTVDIYVMAAAGGLLMGAAPQGAASVFVFVAVIAGGWRVELARGATVVLAGTLSYAVAVLLYNGSAVGLLAYALGFTAALLAASNARQRNLRGEQAELLLAQTQRSHEEQLRAARLEEATRIARDIHDVLAHTLAGLTIQLEATGALLERGADRDAVLERVHRAHELAREGLRETRRAVGALRGDTIATPVPEAIEALVAEYRAGTDAGAELTIDGDRARLSGQIGEAVVRAVQEALTNVRKHAPGAAVSIAVHAGEAAQDEVVVVVDDRPTVAQPAGRSGVSVAEGLASTGGGYGLKGMRERAGLLGGTLDAGVVDGGWRVELRLPTPPRPGATASAGGVERR
jgi:signal transduction histidine kinase